MTPMRVLIIQTAFAGDLILTLPLVQETKRLIPDASITVLCIPSTAALLANHPAIDTVLVYDKRRADPSLAFLARQLRRQRFSLCLCPHRSLRSAVLARCSGARHRIGFDIPGTRWAFTHVVPHTRSSHEVERNLSLLATLHPDVDLAARPTLHPSAADEAAAAGVIDALPVGRPVAVLAPGSVWATKRWTTEGFADVAAALEPRFSVVLLGGPEDRPLCDEVVQRSGGHGSNAAGRLSFLASAALIRRAAVLITNDSAPIHLATAMGTPTVAIFGATIPEFGFTPFHIPHRIVQVDGLPCRPCGIHGGQRCPIQTFDCMHGINPARVVLSAQELVGMAVETGGHL